MERPLPSLAWLLASTLLLAACGTQAPLPTRQIPAQQLNQAIQLGLTTKAEVLQRYGPTTHQVFDSGNEVWMYRSGDAEFVIQFDHAGIVRKTRRSTPAQLSGAR